MFIENATQAVARTCYTLYFTVRDHGTDSAVIVYQMGKVGSTTVTETLKKLRLNMPVYQVHHLTPEGQQIEEYKASFREKPALRRNAYWTGRYLQRQIAAQDPKKKNWFVVTLTRDPVARNISGFFHSMPRYHPDLYKALDSAADENLFPVLKGTFLQEYPHDKPLEWFDSEMKTAFDIDLYERPFPWAKGYDVVERGNVRLLILRLEDLQSSLQPALEDWLGTKMDSLDVVSANRAANKAYKRSYRDFLEWLTLPADYLDQMYNSKYARHYYTATELNQFTQKWQGRDQ